MSPLSALFCLLFIVMTHFRFLSCSRLAGCCSFVGGTRRRCSLESALPAIPETLALATHGTSPSLPSPAPADFPLHRRHSGLRRCHPASNSRFSPISACLRKSIPENARSIPYSDALQQIAPHPTPFSTASFQKNTAAVFRSNHHVSIPARGPSKSTRTCAKAYFTMVYRGPQRFLASSPHQLSAVPPPRYPLTALSKSDFN